MSRRRRPYKIKIASSVSISYASDLASTTQICFFRGVVGRELNGGAYSLEFSNCARTDMAIVVVLPVTVDVRILTKRNSISGRIEIK